MSYKIEHEMVGVTLHEDNSITFYNKEFDIELGVISAQGEFYTRTFPVDQNSHQNRLNL